jgi:hydroxylamine dehydrogenase
MKSNLLAYGCLVLFLGVLLPAAHSYGQNSPVSELTDECLSCHATATPGIVADWKRSRHSKVTPAEALKNPELQRRVSAEKIPDQLSTVVVGCAECHTLNPGTHKDAFNHNDRKVHVVVSPKDCATCHPTEASQYEKNLMSWARSNLVKNTLYGKLVKAVNGLQTLKDMKTTLSDPDEKTLADSCFHCHGTAVEVKGTEKRETDYGELEFPVFSGWPNQGVGRFNPDGTMGSCTPCHSRHQFSIEAARKPYTCSQCHKGPDVPAYKAYEVSKHGNLFSAMNGEFDFKGVPWTVGKDFTAPTCAVCHVSLLTTTEGDVVSERSHQMSNRIPWRILGLIYAHPHPRSPDTSLIKNKDGQQLPTTLKGEPAAEYLISPEEQTTRRVAMQKVCRSCHSKGWVDGHWARFENTIKTSDEMTRTATEIMLRAWDEKVADSSDLFDEALEKQWVEQWLFYANSTRFSAAMMGNDFGVFENGRWYLAKNIQDMLDHLKVLLKTKTKGR